MGLDKILWLSLSSLVVFAGCSKEENKKVAEESYHYSVNGCDTGNQQFKAGSDEDLKNQLCAALKDDKRNKGCAYEERFKHFQKRCKDQKWTTAQAEKEVKEAPPVVDPTKKDQVPATPPPPSMPRTPSETLPEVPEGGIQMPPPPVPGDLKSPFPAPPANGKSRAAYHFNINGCDTGAKVFYGDSPADAKQKMCASLKDNGANNGCAAAEREVYYKQACL